MHVRKPIARALAGFLFVTAAAATLAQSTATGDSYKKPPGALIAAGDAPELILLYTGDVIGYLEPCG